MNCLNCNTTSLPGAKFCSNCSHELTIKGQPNSESTDRRQPHRNNDPYQISLEKWREMKKGKLKNAVIYGSIAAGLGCAVGWLFSQESFGMMILALMFGGWAIIFCRRVTTKNYYALPHSRDASGEHRCIFCGNRGIYRRGQYKSNNTHSNCSKWQDFLYTE